MKIKIIKNQWTPGELLAHLQRQKGVFLLESSLTDPQRGRYSILGYDPFFTVQGETIADFQRWSKRMRSFKCPRLKGVPLMAGIFGYLSYDFGLQFERVKSRHAQAKIPGFLFHGYDGLLIIDHLKNQLIVTATGLAEKHTRLRRLRAQAQIEQCLKLLFQPMEQKSQRPKNRLMKVRAGFTRPEYLQVIRRALAAIRAGDIYQVNLSQAFQYDFRAPVNSVELYESLRELSPSFYGGYFDAGDFQIVSSSPELFLKLRGSRVETRPMKGTASRIEKPMLDRAQRQKLLNSAKERAELLMVTDLERNDLGRVCEFGSVKVKTLRDIETYKTVYQATATITGRLRRNYDAFDLIQAAFPGGSITGCPKIRAMQLIDQLEKGSRGLYTGAFGYLSFSGDLAMNVLIRTLLVKKNQVAYHVGGGIVSDSTPEHEYDETLLKAKAMQMCLRTIL